MPEENQNAPANPSAVPPVAPPQSSQQAPQPQQQTPSPPPQQPTLQQPNPRDVYPTPANTQGMVGLSASQMGFNQPKGKFSKINPKKLLIVGGATLASLGALLAVLALTNILPFSQLKTIGYTNSKNVSYKLKFYAKHDSRTLGTGNTQLVSKVSKEGKFPVVLSINTGSQSGTSTRYKNCTGLQKAFEVQNDNLGQKIAVCDALGGRQVSGKDASGSVYLAVISVDKDVHIVTIGQDYSQAELSSASQAQASLKRFGLTPYNNDIKKIVASIKIEK